MTNISKEKAEHAKRAGVAPYPSRLAVNGQRQDQLKGSHYCLKWK